jgi:hypothetical protein
MWQDALMSDDRSAEAHRVALLAGMCVTALLLVPTACSEKPSPATPRITAPAPPPATAQPEPSAPSLLPPDGMGLVTFETEKGPARFRVEVVERDESRAQGLMWRRNMARDAGMLFVFPADELQSFWMRNTYLPLDMIFVNSQRQVVGVVERAEPLTETPRMVGRPSRYVVELNAGLAREHAITFGTKMQLEWRRMDGTLPTP